MAYESLISADDLSLHINDLQWLIFDCRFDLADMHKGELNYRVSHIPGAVYAHIDYHLSSPISPLSGRHPLPDATRLTEWLASCGFNGQQQVVVYDDLGGSMAVRLWWLLKALGHEPVAVLDGGWQAWTGAGYAIDDAVPASTGQVRFNAGFNPSMLVNTDQVTANLVTRDFTLVDVRTAERFEGISEPIDPVAGHIPGAVNIPLTENLAADGLFKPAAELQSMYRPLLSEDSCANLAFMCGSGVTACHSILAMVHAGFTMPRLYAGSWSEWIRDPQHAIAIGKANAELMGSR